MPSAFQPTVQQSFPLAGPTEAGMVSTSAQTFAGKKTLDGGALIKGDTTGNAIASGYVGEVVSASLSNVALASATTANIGTINLTSGVWVLYAKTQIQFSSEPTTWTDINISISTTSAIGDNTNNCRLTSFSKTSFNSIGTCVKYLNVSTTTTYPVYLTASTTYTGGAGVSSTAAASQFLAVRIA